MVILFENKIPLKRSNANCSKFTAAFFCMMEKMNPRLSVNINKIALIRNSRGANLPDLSQVARDCERFGAQGITVHPRPDERHVRKSDISSLKKIVSTEFNIEGYPSSEFVNLVVKTKPEQVTLVPDPPGALTSDHGWDIKEYFNFLVDVLASFKSAAIRTSLFIDADPKVVDWARKVGVDRVELYTGPYAAKFDNNPGMAVEAYKLTAQRCQAEGLGINAGHDLNLRNLSYFRRNVPGLLEVSIGHALVCDAIYIGLENSIQRYLWELQS